MILSRFHIGLILGIAVAAWALLLHLRGLPLNWEQLAPFGAVLTILATVSWCAEHWLWRVSWLHFVFRRPNLRGTWKVVLRSNWSEIPDQDEMEIVGFMGVEQSFSSLKMHLMTEESESWTLSGSVQPSPSGTGYQVSGIYANKPNLELRGNRSEIHLGAFVLSTHGARAKPTSVDGDYWTDRGTAGRMVLSDRHSSIVSQFTAASELLET